MNSYFEQMILSATPLELVRMLYQKGLAALKDAREHLRCGRVEERCACINLAYRVLLELTGSLNEAEAPDFSLRLKSLYLYMQGRLVEANLRQADSPLAEVEGLLQTLAEAWVSISNVPAAESGDRRIAVSA